MTVIVLKFPNPMNVNVDKKRLMKMMSNKVMTYTVNGMLSRIVFTFSPPKTVTFIVSSVIAK